MGLVFRYGKIERTDEGTALIGHVIHGAAEWPGRVRIPVDEDGGEHFSAALRGVGMVGLDDLQVAVVTDSASWDRNFQFPRPMASEQPFRLILDGLPRGEMPDAGLAWGIEERHPPDAAPATAIQDRSAAPAAALPGLPLREYPYRINRWSIALFAPWFMFLTLGLLTAFALFALWRPAEHVDLARWSALALFGMVDVFLLSVSVKMLLTPRSHILVTDAGIVLPIFDRDPAGQHVTLPFAAMSGMLEYWHKESVRLIKLKTPSGDYFVNVFLMNRSDFEELRRLLWLRISEERARLARPGLATPSS